MKLNMFKFCPISLIIKLKEFMQIIVVYILTLESVC